jgi:hypothetical protein
MPELAAVITNDIRNAMIVAMYNANTYGVARGDSLRRLRISASELVG